MPPVRFELTTSADERPQTYALDRAATGTVKYLISIKLKSVSSLFAIIKPLSSANKIGLDLSDTLLERSLTYIRNNNGPIMFQKKL